MPSASFKHIAANTAAFSTAFAGAYRASECAAKCSDAGAACNDNAAERSFSKIGNNRFCGPVASALMDGEFSQDAENGGTKAVLGKACKTVAKRCVSLCSDIFHYTPELGGFKYRAAGLLAVA